MPKIPLAEFAPRPTPDSTVRANPHMYDAEFAGQQSIARGTGDIGSGLSKWAEVSQKAKEADERATIDNSRFDFEQFDNEWFESQRTRTGDFDKMGAEYEKAASAFADKNTPKNLSQSGQEIFTEFKRRWLASGTFNADKIAVAKQIESAKLKRSTAFKRAIAAGDVAGAEATVAGGVETGLYSAAEAESLRQSIIPQVSEQKAYATIAADPTGAIDAIKNNPGEYPGLTPHKIKTLEAAARNQFNVRRQETLDDINERDLAGEEIPETEINDLVEKKMLKAFDAKRLSREWKLRAANDPASQRPQFLAAMDLISKHDSATAKPADVADISGAMLGLVGTYKEEAERAWKERRDPKSPVNAPAAKQAFDIITQNFNEGVYGHFRTVPKVEKIKNKKGVLEDSPVYDITGKPVYETDPILFEKAQAKRARDYDALSRYVAQNPNATFSEMQKFLSSLNTPEAVKAGAALFGNAFK